MSKKLRNLQRQRGLTLIEIIVVLSLLVIVMTFVTSGLTNAGNSAKAKLNEIKMNAVKGKINQYRFQYNSFPPSLASLSGCDQNTGPSCVPIATEDEIKDAYGNVMKYQVNSDGRTFTIGSYGSDGKDGGSGADSDQVIKGP
jgi:general secretion pathway protein G